MSSYFRYQNDNILLPSDCSLSVGNTCETRERRMSDGSKTSYSISTFTKPQVNTYSVGFNRSLNECPDMMKELYKWEDLVGKSVDFTYCGIPFGSVMVSDLSVSFALDATLGVVGFSLTFNLRDNVVLTKKSEKINVRFE